MQCSFLNWTTRTITESNCTWNWYHWLSENLTRCVTRTSVFAGTTLRGAQYFLIGSAQNSWMAPEDSGGGGLQTLPFPPLPSGATHESFKPSQPALSSGATHEICAEPMRKYWGTPRNNFKSSEPSVASPLVIYTEQLLFILNEVC